MKSLNQRSDILLILGNKNKNHLQYFSQVPSPQWLATMDLLSVWLYILCHLMRLSSHLYYLGFVCTLHHLILSSHLYWYPVLLSLAVYSPSLSDVNLPHVLVSNTLSLVVYSITFWCYPPYLYCHLLVHLASGYSFYEYLHVKISFGHSWSWGLMTVSIWLVQDIAYCYIKGKFSSDSAQYPLLSHSPQWYEEIGTSRSLSPRLVSTSL